MEKTPQDLIAQMLQKQKYVPAKVAYTPFNPDGSNEENDSVLCFIIRVEKGANGHPKYYAADKLNIAYPYAVPFDVFTGEVIKSLPEELG